MPPLELLTLLLVFTRYAVRSAPLQHRDIYSPLEPLKSVAGDLLGFATAFAGPDSTGKQFGATPAASLTDTQQTPAASAGTSGTQNVFISTATTQATGNSGTGSITISGTATQLSTGGVSPSSSGDAILSGAATTTDSAGSANSSPGSNEASNGVIPTTTGSIGASSTGTSSGSGSNSGPGSASGSGSSSGGSSGAGSGSGSGSGSDSPSSPASTTSTSLSAGEIAAAVILPVLALLALLFLLFRYNKRLREKHSTWNQTRLERAAYRRALDDPILSFGMRQQNNPGLGMGDVEQLLRPLRPLSFGFSDPRRPFPRQQRKPLQWDPSRVGGNTASAIGMAVPLPAGQHSRSASEVSEDSDIYGGGGDDRPGSRSQYQDARPNQVSPDNATS
ncbi:hypothetical protein A1O7_05719 [Cladophialophora yegresii CBS 114405]|uniref:Uncharacterized protein n=1 Tax=Cladophialophora yegresii CBS 114405 TaxID=1182544 RepID=W9WIG7_9EURO|nr:uncharacterized protein A1O7_05719 [Cladophialophora yegresii CBS 114405]EXJ58294.1 hypothetical protein A1O7_05719 [Cladophialophora yegresii CBS 114405]